MDAARLQVQPRRELRAGRAGRARPLRGLRAAGDARAAARVARRHVEPLQRPGARRVPGRARAAEDPGHRRGRRSEALSRPPVRRLPDRERDAPALRPARAGRPARALFDRRSPEAHTLRTSAKIGGAYLFAVALPVAPYVAADKATRAIDGAYRRARKAATARGLKGVAATRAAVRAARLIARPQTYVRPPDVAVLATFAGGRTLRVAGKGRTRRGASGPRRTRGSAAAAGAARRPDPRARAAAGPLRDRPAELQRAARDHPFRRPLHLDAERSHRARRASPNPAATTPRQATSPRARPSASSCAVAACEPMAASAGAPDASPGRSATARPRDTPSSEATRFASPDRRWLRARSPGTLRGVPRVPSRRRPAMLAAIVVRRGWRARRRPSRSRCRAARSSRPPASARSRSA